MDKTIAKIHDLEKKELDEYIVKKITIDTNSFGFLARGSNHCSD